jgi:hypothetical protein
MTGDARILLLDDVGTLVLELVALVTNPGYHLYRGNASKLSFSTKFTSKRHS